MVGLKVYRKRYYLEVKFLKMLSEAKGHQAVLEANCLGGVGGVHPLQMLEVRGSKH